MIGQQIKYYRQINKITQDELAKLLFVNRQAISKWENEYSYPNITNLIEMSKIFKISLDKLILNKDSIRNVNITNGDCFNDYIKAQFEDIFIPFREAMIDGPSSKELFNDEFDNLRALFHHTTNEEYKEHMDKFYQVINHLNDYDEITLWFGEDTFCQMNLLTILAYLDYHHYNNVFIITIDDQTKKIIKGKDKAINDSYYDKYVKLMLEHKEVSFNDYNLNQAVNDYLDLNSDEGAIATLIKENKDKLTRRELVELVWDKTRKYGLGDTQVFNRIEKYTEYRFNK